MKRRACLAAILIVLAGASTNSAVAQGTLEFRATLPDDFTPDPRHWFNMPPGQGQLFLEPGQVRFTVIYISIRYVPYVGYLHAAAPSGEQSQSLDLLAFGTRTEASFGDGNWGSIYRGAIPLTQFTTTELDGLVAGSWQLRFSTPDNLSDYLGGTFVAVPEPSVLGLGQAV